MNFSIFFTSNISTTIFYHLQRGPSPSARPPNTADVCQRLHRSRPGDCQTSAEMCLRLFCPCCGHHHHHPYQCCCSYVHDPPRRPVSKSVSDGDSRLAPFPSVISLAAVSLVSIRQTATALSAPAAGLPSLTTRDLQG